MNGAAGRVVSVIGIHGIHCVHGRQEIVALTYLQAMTMFELFKMLSTARMNFDIAENHGGKQVLPNS